jgi:hypothetical protein
MRLNGLLLIKGLSEMHSGIHPVAYGSGRLL